MNPLAKQFVWGISERKDGNMKFVLGRKNAGKNRKNFFDKLGINIRDTISAGLVHGQKVKIVGKKDSRRIIPGVDGLITDNKNLFLTITTADCLPLYFFDQKNKVVGLAHAGWRGILKNISKKMIKAMERNYETKASDVIIHIGPHIKVCHFQVQTDVAERFKKWPESIKQTNGRFYIDLAEIVKRQLVISGVKAKNISVSAECTYDQKKIYFSYRREGEKGGFMMAYIGRK